MKKIFVFILTLLLAIPILSTAKQSTAPQKNSQQKVYAKKNAKKKAYVKKDKKRKLARKRKVRFAHHINKPQEGEVLKIEAMTKDLNEQ